MQKIINVLALASTAVSVAIVGTGAYVYINKDPMAEEVKEEVLDEEHPEEEKKSVLGKVKDAILPDADEQAAIISTMVRITVLAWSGGILTLNYVAIPGVPQQKIDPTFIASVFTGVLASFGIQTASKKGDGTMKMEIEKASQTGPTQTIRIEQAPIKISTDEKPYQL